MYLVEKKIVKLVSLPKEPTVIYVGNKSTVAMIENLVQYGRIKQVNVRFYTLRMQRIMEKLSWHIVVVKNNKLTF